MHVSKDNGIFHCSKLIQHQSRPPPTHQRALSSRSCLPFWISDNTRFVIWNTAGDLTPWRNPACIVYGLTAGWKSGVLPFPVPGIDSATTFRFHSGKESPQNAPPGLIRPPLVRGKAKPVHYRRAGTSGKTACACPGKLGPAALQGARFTFGALFSWKRPPGPSDMEINLRHGVSFKWNSGHVDDMVKWRAGTGLFGYCVIYFGVAQHWTTAFRYLEM